MTSPTIQLMNSCRDLVKVPAFKNDFWTITQEELERFYVKAQAQALRDAAENVTIWIKELEVDDRYYMREQLQRLADDLERKA